MKSIACCLIAAVVAITRSTWAAPDPAERDNVEEVQNLVRNAQRLYELGSYRDAIAGGERGLKEFEPVLGADHPAIIDLAHILALLHKTMGEYARAEVLYQRVLAAAEKRPGQPGVDIAGVLNNMAALYDEKGDYRRAEALALRAVEVLEKTGHGDDSVMAAALGNLANTYRQKSDYDRVEALYVRCLDILERTVGQRHAAVATALVSLATVREQKGDYATVESLYRRALSILEDVLGPEHPNFAPVLDRLAAFYETRHDREHAEPMRERALAIREKVLGEKHPDVAASLNNLAQLYLDKDDPSRAEPLLLRALAIWEQQPRSNERGAAAVLDNLSSLHIRGGDRARAEGYVLRSLALRQRAFKPDDPDLAHPLTNLALLHEAKSEFRLAKPLLQRALKVREKAFGSIHPDVASSLANLAALFHRSGDYVQARSFLARSIDAHEEVLARILPATTEDQKRAYFSSLDGLTDAAISLNVAALPNDDQACALALATLLRRKGRILDAQTESLRALRARGRPETVAALNELSKVRSEIASRTVRGPETGQRLQDHLAKLQTLAARSARLEAILAGQYAELGMATKPTTIAHVASALGKESALVEFAVYQHFRPTVAVVGHVGGMWGEARYVAYVLSAQARLRWVDLGDARQIDDLVQKARTALARKDVSYSGAGRALDEVVMRPVRALLGDVRDVKLSPDGQLNLLPFAALVDENGQYLLRRYRFTYLTSGRDLLRAGQTRSASTPPVIFANPDFDAPAKPGQQGNGAHGAGKGPHLRFAALPGTAAEGAALSKLLPGAHLLTGAAATEVSLKRVQAPHILHLATHGFFLPGGPGEVRLPVRGIQLVMQGYGTVWPGQLSGDPLLRSGLALAGANVLGSGSEDGIVTALEILGLDLRGTKLVTLSACETGVGDVKNGEGIYGLRRALVLAGAETQVISLWKVADEATQRLMTAYYMRLKGSEPRGEALRQAQLALLDSGATAHPFYWASFISNGDAGPLDGAGTARAAPAPIVERPTVGGQRAEGAERLPTDPTPPEGDVAELLATIPAGHGRAGADWGVAFSRDSRRVAYRARDAGGVFIVSGGRKGPSFDDVRRPIFSPDGRRIAYAARTGTKEFIVVDGRRGPPFNEVGRPVFSPDGRRVAYRAKDFASRKTVMMIDDRRAGAYDMVDTPEFSPDGKKVFYVAHPRFFYMSKSGSMATDAMELLVNGQKIAAAEGLEDPVYSADGRRLAYVAIDGLYGGARRARVVVNDQEQQVFRDVRFPAFSPDGKTLAFAASAGDRWFVVVGGVRGPSFEMVSGPVVGANGLVAYSAKSGATWSMVVSGDIEVPKVGPAFTEVGQPVVDESTGRIAYRARSEKGWHVVSGAVRSPPHDSVSDPVFVDRGRSIVYGTQDGRELRRRTLVPQ